MCTPELARQAEALIAAGVAAHTAAQRIAELGGPLVSAATVRNWARGVVPKDMRVGERVVRRAPPAVTARKVLKWRQHTGQYRFQSVGGKYRIQVIHGRRGLRFLCWFCPGGFPVYADDGRLIAGAPPVGLFAFRVALRDATGDAQHHALTGEIRP